MGAQPLAPVQSAAFSRSMTATPSSPLRKPASGSLLWQRADPFAQNGDATVPDWQPGGPSAAQPELSAEAAMMQQSLADSQLDPDGAMMGFGFSSAPIADQHQPSTTRRQSSHAPQAPELTVWNSRRGAGDQADAAQPSNGAESDQAAAVGLLAQLIQDAMRVA